MKHSIIAASTNRPRTVYALLLTAVVVAFAMLFRIQVDTDPENMLPDDQPDRVFHNRVEETFGLHDAIVVGLVNEDHPQGVVVGPVRYADDRPVSITLGNRDAVRGRRNIAGDRCGGSG